MAWLSLPFCRLEHVTPSSSIKRSGKVTLDGWRSDRRRRGLWGQLSLRRSGPRGKNFGHDIRVHGTTSEGGALSLVMAGLAAVATESDRRSNLGHGSSSLRRGNLGHGSSSLLRGNLGHGSSSLRRGKAPSVLNGSPALREDSSRAVANALAGTAGDGAACRTVAVGARTALPKKRAPGNKCKKQGAPSGSSVGKFRSVFLLCFQLSLLLHTLGFGAGSEFRASFPLLTCVDLRLAIKVKTRNLEKCVS